MRFRIVVAAAALLAVSASVALGAPRAANVGPAAPRADKAHVSRWYNALKRLRDEAASIVAKAPRSQDDASLIAWAAGDFYTHERAYERAVTELSSGSSPFSEIASSLQDVDPFLIGAVQNAMECNVVSGRANLQVVDAYIAQIGRMFTGHADPAWQPPNVSVDSAYRCRS